MNFEIIENGAFAALKVNLQPGEAIKAEMGSMLSKDIQVDVEGKMDGGLLGGIGRMLAGETLFLQTLSTTDEGGELILSPSSLGNILMLNCTDKVVWNIAKDGFFAGEMSLSISAKMQNLARGVFSGEGFFVVKVSGKGKLFIKGFGAIIKIHIPEGKEYMIDNHHLLAWPEHAQIKIEKGSKAWLSSLSLGVGLVTKVKGPCDIYVQSRNARAFGSWVLPFLPIKK